MASLKQKRLLLLKPGRPRVPVITSLRNLGLTSGLQICLDAGDANSYSSGQSWLDLSGNGDDLFLGATSGATATDPTFNGTAGGRSKEEYFSFDGADYFHYDGVANPTWADNMHKDSAAFTLVSWFWPGSATSHGLMGTSQSNNNNIGIVWSCNASNGNNTVNVSNGTGAAARSVALNVGVTASVWNFLAFRLDEAGNNCFAVRNATKSADQAASYTTPSASAATWIIELGSFGNGSGPVSNTSRMAVFLVYSAALTYAQINSIFNATRVRFGV